MGDSQSPLGPSRQANDQAYEPARYIQWGRSNLNVRTVRYGLRQSVNKLCLVLGCFDVLKANPARVQRPLIDNCISNVRGERAVDVQSQ